MKKDIKIPTILGIVLLVISLVAGIYLTGQKTSLFTKASSTCIPAQILTTNITDNSFVVAFSTDSDCLASLVINNLSLQDSRSSKTDGTLLPSKTHYFEISNLSQNTDYQFSLISDGETHTSPDYRVKTSSKPKSAIPNANLAWGKVLTPDKQPASGSIVLLQIEGATLLSSLVTSSGNWNISLASSFNENKDDWFTPPENKSEEIIVLSEDGTVTQIAGNTSNNNPVPDIIVGQNQLVSNFVAPSAQTSSLQSVSPVQSQPTLYISSPKEGESVASSRPQFFGTGPINSKITLVVDSAPTFSESINTDALGAWKWSPDQDLSPGQHTVSISSVDTDTGMANTISHQFTVLAADNNSLSFTASGSGNLVTPTSVPTLLPSPTTTVVPTLIPTAIPTIVPTGIPTVSTPQPSTDSGMPVSGSVTMTLIIICLSVTLFVASVIFVI